ncbi:zinc finger and SCAN domain-containing protein 2-like [Scomber scombrus]|uniref:Zinc finger and SCAN domain-containing protein 2-like n=1 Tax=Scomber scombrus TaxID=13677 RepID=A0AAV1P0T1_SCOSC
MDATMFQLRSFVHRRLYAAAEEILGEVEKTITLALYEAEVSRSKEEMQSVRHQLGLLPKKSESSPTSKTVEHGDECEFPLLQENPGPSMPEESNFSLSAEVPGPSQTNTDLDNNNWKYCLVETDFKMSEIKQEQDEPWDDGHTQEANFPSPEVVKIEQHLPGTPGTYEMQPVSSDGSAAQSESNESDEDLVSSKEEKTEMMKRNAKMLQAQSGSVNEKSQAELPYKNFSAKGQKDRSFCHLCGKGFQYIGSLMKHIKTHDKKIDCTVCGITYQSTKDLGTHNSCGYYKRMSSQKKCHICKEKIGVASKTCQHCGAKQPYKQILEKRKKRVSLDWKERQKKNCNVNKVYDATNLLLHKWDILERHPVLLLSRRTTNGFVTEYFCPWKMDTEDAKDAFVTIKKIYESLLNVKEDDHPPRAWFWSLSVEGGFSLPLS